jgi:LPS-assembly lipoprotein
MQSTRMTKTFLILALGLLLGACGFHLRGQGVGSYSLPFQNVYVDGDANSIVVIELKRSIQASGARLTERATEADAVVQILRESRERIVMSLSGAGKVREYQVRLRLSFRASDGKDKEFIAPAEITLNRSYAFDDAQTLAKETEENLLYRDMQSDAAQQIMHRLGAVNPAK